jgi:hypothetical protein
MDLKQRKLSKSEWESIEIPVSQSENEILKLIIAGFHNVHIKINKTNSIFTFLKIEYNSQIEDFLYVKYFADNIKKLVTETNTNFIHFNSLKRQSTATNTTALKPNEYNISVNGIVKLKSGDEIRVNKIDIDSENTNDIYEFILYSNLEKMVTYKFQGKSKWHYYYYTLNILIKNNIEKVNRIIKDIVKIFLLNYEPEANLMYILENSPEYIEKNKSLLKYNDLHLYEHQKEIFTSIKSKKPKLILYIAPTGTGKTLTPLGLSEKYRVIFVCAARHVGLALARSSISIGKKIAFAFGCSSAEDVRLHYFAAKDYTVNKRTGQIKKVDNTVGDKVEIIICDIRSYISAMFYMLAFNKAENIVTYWDEPTITMDYTNHELHKIIKKNWSQNLIPNFVLSSATLPKMEELTQTISDFHEKFSDSSVANIVSHDCRKTIPLIDNNGYTIMPHYLHNDYTNILTVVSHCEANLTLLRYFDLKEAADFISYIENNSYNSSKSKFNRNFATIDDIDMKTIKIHYLRVLKSIKPEHWSTIHGYFTANRCKRLPFNSTVDTKGNKIAKPISRLSGQPLTRLISEQVTATNGSNMEPVGSSGVYITTKDAYTLKDGPTIFLANDLQKIAKFCIQQSNIPAVVMKDIMDKIAFNNEINSKIAELEDELEIEEQRLAAKMTSGSGTGNSAGQRKDRKKASKIAENKVEKTNSVKMTNIKENISAYKSMVKRAVLDDIFIPNKLQHLQKWAENLNTTNSFTSKIDDDVIASIMLLKDVDDSWKILLLLGIGVFTEHKSIAYTEIMKKMADTQKLYLIIADSDYIYGTNYQFCHGYISKDLELTQEKIIQALGRIGRNNIQQEYSARFRDDSQIQILFRKFESEEKPEVINMNILFNSKNIRWTGTEYEELPDKMELDSDFEEDDEEEEAEDEDNEDNEDAEETV